MTKADSSTVTGSDLTEQFIWTNSGDSHFREPLDVFNRYMSPELAERMPRSVKDPSNTIETVYVDGQIITRPLPKPIRDGEHQGKSMWDVNHAPPGAEDSRLRLKDLDGEGVWGEVCYPSLGFWATSISDPNLASAGAQAINDWAYEEILSVSSRLVPAFSISVIEPKDAVLELIRCAERGFRVMFLPVDPAEGRWNEERWEPLWVAAEEANVVLGVHVGTDRDRWTFRLRNPGGAVYNYVETTFGGQRVVTQLIAAGVLDRHPNLKVLVSEGGATWAPFLGDRMNEGYRQHQAMAWPKLSLLPKEYIYRQVYASFQHDETAIPTVTAMGFRNVMFGEDYPHTEGTFGHTQETLRNLFAGVDEDVRYHVTIGAFLELFPEVGLPPALNS